jgi:ATP-binding cassette subfamily B protein
LLNRTLEEAIHRSKSIILDGSQSAQLDQFWKLDQTMRQGRSSVQFLSTYPKILTEGIILITIVIFAFLSVLTSGNRIQAMIPLLGTLALGAQKLIPAIQMVYASWAGIASNAPAVEQVLNWIATPTALRPRPVAPLQLNNKLILEHVSYRHRKGNRRALKDVSLTINAGEVIGLIGPSGSGKSTLADILMGLLPPDQGDVLVDDASLYAKAPVAGLDLRWQRSIAYVANPVYLLPASVAENICCQVGASLDLTQIRWAAALAALDGFIDSLPEGYATRVGSGGLAISHGQRQRIGLARALLQQRPVLVLDEATAALDLETEGQIMRQLRQLSPALTVVFITHRRESLKHCERVFHLNQGQLLPEPLA